MQRLRFFLFPLALALTLVLPLWLPTDAATTDDRGFERALKKARKNLSKKNYEKAIPYFVQANALAGGSCRDCLQGLGIAARRSQNPELALSAYEQLMELGGVDSFGALQRVISLSLRIDEPLRGAAASRHFLRSWTDGEREATWALNELGLLLVASGDETRLEEASSAFQEALEWNGYASEILRLNAAEIHWRLQRKDQARALLRHLTLVEPGESPSFRQIELSMDHESEIADRIYGPEGWPEQSPQGWSVNVPAGERWREVADLGDVEAVLSHLIETIGVDAPIEDRAVACAARVAPEELNARLIQAHWPGPFLGSTAVTRPRVKYAPQPGGPEEGTEARIQVSFSLMVIVDEAGEVPWAIGFNSLPLGLKESGIETAHRWKFEPARREDRPISVCDNIDIEFKFE